MIRVSEVSVEVRPQMAGDNFVARERGAGVAPDAAGPDDGAGNAKAGDAQPQELGRKRGRIGVV
jgi:hypothetical protein